MTTHDTPARTAADVYDELFLETLCLPWARRLLAAVPPAPGDRVLDIACGTGAVASVAAPAAGGTGSVIGLDRSGEMLAVARRRLPQLDWREGDAQALPFGDGGFDVVLCQFGLMFVDDRELAVREMLRVLRHGGRVGLVVWDGIDRSPAYATLTETVEARLGPDASAPIRRSFALGDAETVAALLDGAGFASVEAASVPAVARFATLATWVDAELKGWVGGGFGDEAYSELLVEAERVLAPWVRADGRVEFDLPAVVASGVRPLPAR
jgi:SAM-dependent methyltransferase